MLLGGEIQLAGDVYAALHRASNRARVGIDPKRPLYLLTILLVGGKMKSLFDPLDDEYLVLRLYLPHRVGVEVLEGNVTCYQRAPKGAEQSAAGSSDEVVEGCVMGLHFLGRDAVVLGNLAVDTEEDGLFLDGEIRTANPALHQLHSDLGEIGYIGHTVSFLPSRSLIP